MSERKIIPLNQPAPKLVITRVFDAPRHLVFEAWTKPEHIKQWSAPHGFTIPESEGQFRSGGAWRALMVAPDGEEHRLSGVYKEIIEDKLIVFTHAWLDENGKRGHETVVTVRLEDEGNKTKLTFEQAFFESVESRDGHQGGWTQCFERLAELLAKLQRHVHA